MRSTTTKTVARAFTDFFHRRKILLSSSYLPQPYRSLYSTSATTATTRTRTKVISVLQGNDVRGIGGCHYCYKYPSSTISSRCNYSSSRYNSSSSSNNKSKNKNKRFDLQALPFSISPEEALESFRKWAENDQGLRYLMSYNSVRIGAAYVPVWSFDLNIRFKQQQQQQQQQYSWKPPIFQAYDRGGQQKKNKQQGVIYLPGGLSAYSGYSYRRSLINPVHSTTLIFMGEQTQPFGGWMLNDMVLKETGNPIPVIPDAWNSTQGRAFSVVKEELQEIVDEAWINEKYDNNNDDDIPPPTVQTQVVTARRVLMPTFVIEYNILGLEYTAFVSGCDRSAPVGGVSHRIFESNNDNTIGGLSPEFHRSSQNILTQLSSGASQLIRKMNLPILVGLLRPFFTILWFVFIRLLSITPVIGVAGGLFTGFRKILQPWMDNRKASADWERQRQHEAEMVEDADNDTNNKSNMNDFTDYSGTARAHFNKNKDEILRSLSGDAKHQEGDFDWYSDWEGKKMFNLSGVFVRERF
ncbi:MAG: hypothetical protein ACI8RD_001474 [Bacillariaceae sp.]|jgi:hypothetical protein